MNSDLERHLAHASGYLDLKMYEDALRETDAVLAVEPENPRASALKAAILWHTNRLKEAEPYVTFLAERNPNESGIWVNLAYIRRRTQSIEAAVATLQRALEADPTDALAHFNMACYRAVQDRVTEAIALLKSALALDPKLKTLAKQEEDFNAIRHLPEFKKLV